MGLKFRLMALKKESMCLSSKTVYPHQPFAEASRSVDYFELCRPIRMICDALFGPQSVCMHDQAMAHEERSLARNGWLVLIWGLNWRGRPWCAFSYIRCFCMTRFLDVHVSLLSTLMTSQAAQTPCDDLHKTAGLQLLFEVFSGVK